MAKCLRKWCGDLTEVALDNDDVKDDDDDDNSKDAEVVKIVVGEIITILDRLVNLKYLLKEKRNFLVAKLDKIRVLSKKQKHISDHFMLQSSFYDRFY